MLSPLSLAHARKQTRVFFKKEGLPTSLLLLSLLLLLPLGLDQQLVRHQSGDRRRGRDRESGQRVLPAPDAVGGDGERAHARREEVVGGEALLLWVVVVVVVVSVVFWRVLGIFCESCVSERRRRRGGRETVGVERKKEER